MSSRPSCYLGSILGLALLAGCAVGPDYQSPATPQGDRFEADVPSDRFDQATAPEITWWEHLGDPTLNQLIERAASDNLSLEASEARLRAARAVLGLAESERWPGGDLTSSAVEIKDGTDPSETSYSAGVGASWELDLFGRVRRTIEAESASYEERATLHRAVFVAVSSEVARTYLQLRGFQAAQVVAQQNVTNDEEGLEIIEALERAGRGTELQVQQTRERLETIRAALPELEALELAARHRLAVLVGETPTALYPLLRPAAELPSVPQEIAIGDPASLLRRRPDVVAAERRLAAATARIGVATADLFPRVSLNATFTTSTTELDALSDSETNSTSIGPFLSWAVFDLARIRRRIEAFEQEAEALVADYERTVLLALEETETALVRLDRFRRRQAHRERAEAAAEAALHLARLRYDAGLTDFLTVLDADDRLLSAQEARLRGATEVGTAYVTLYTALGGGWETPGTANPPATP